MKLAGVYQATKKDGTIYYRSSFTYKNKHISLGSFSTIEEAGNAYREGSFIAQNPSITLFEHSKEHLLSFEKWVIIINLRDNNLYIPNPIYMRKNYFSYYLDEQTELKFSIDDLFFYSSHKILRRNGHLYVNDYGMQLSILSRYGIKPYAILGKDYIVKNGDKNDLRYENIEVKNAYQGVTLTTHYKKSCYQTKLHLHGDYIVGYYDDAIKAAIAYNKAIDIVKKNGCMKNFKPNYTEGISPSTYADIYSKLKISDNILNYINVRH